MQFSRDTGLFERKVERDAVLRQYGAVIVGAITTVRTPSFAAAST